MTGRRGLFPKKGFSRVWTLERVRAGRAGGHCRWLHGDADPPHEQGAGLLRCVPFGAMVRVDGGRPTSRGLPPAVVWGTGDVRKRGLFPQKGILKGLLRLSF